MGTGLLVLFGDPETLMSKFEGTVSTSLSALSSKDENARLRTAPLKNQINNVENIVDILG